MATPDFIVRQRAKLGHELLWLSGTTAVVLRQGEDGLETLLIRRSDNGLWCPVAGIIDPGEHPFQAALREVREEAGVVAEVERLAWVTITDVIEYENGDRTQYIDHIFRCQWLGGEPRPDHEETTEARFFPVDALPPMAEKYADRVRVVLEDRPETRLGPYAG
ncbi:ADP-ribose pyrophosphatase YjhB, NUDIX family [Raineyella antarctica]|uniref:ADP-ribose pyrophosphatase YjhB, NUDIX family n=1 Tax=Raineyella antarctica TaxID=1577474 RepID=A0A1G6GWV3_9ACTN|nr:NUDIX domain-containing protein [Raineyella antarctica]SDB86454.1 ADP-ribose pyrophosphatase YjhB, NUDIX family [Raineyella antarctica]